MLLLLLMWILMTCFELISSSSSLVVDTMNVFRAILQKDEKSERALTLTAEVCVLHPF